ncbi:nickel ABC transporter permease [Halalkalibacter akibai]|uniref:Nickel import system permease protein NikB n=1 Tax=Halalkalibacter akibai (strain ATCC 43226 / DSM 21942 / CIP 109018 / JCM 9157 / 1139) TaxID=1236973 RepID=W4QXQ1_HALA3|nr:nickel ABC transporter permease [Halalkalibacter akibai]GAE36104.1 dipeptide transport system permease protein DppB [Halalkalibacter akibai JCM 9157]
MLRFCLERIFHLILIVFILSTLTFILLRISPGDPALIMLTAHGMPASLEVLLSVREELGLTDSIWIQYGQWLKSLALGQWGNSYVSKEPVLTELIKRLPATLELAVAGLVVMTFMTLLIGISSAIWAEGWLNRFSKLLALLGSAIPSFWLAFLLIYFFSVRYGFFPTTGRGSWRHLVLPALTLGIGMSAVYARVLRANMLELLNRNFVKAAKARGLSTSRILIFHLFKHAFLPILTMIGTSFAFMLGGSIIVETIFSWPGLGRYVIQAILQRDYPVIQGYVIFASLLFFFIHFLVDLIYGWLDPRLRITD